jgi:membrane protein implicated in regulation of membrane protease activity
VDFRAEAWQLFVNIMIVAVMLTVAALFESVELQLLQDEPALFWVTWVPFAGIVALAIVLNRRLGRMRREKSSGLSSQLKREDSPHL